MAKKVIKTPAAIELTDQVRWLAAAWQHRTGFVSRCRHAEKQVIIGHELYHSDPEVAAQIDSILYALRHLDAGRASGYEIKGLHEVDPHPVEGQLSLIG